MADEDGEISETAATALTLVAHPSTSNSAANLLPKQQRLVHLPSDSQTIVGRDRSYLPLIRLKSLQVSKVHATLYRDELDTTKWFVVDNASTHGTFIRREGEKEWTRLAERGYASLPVELRHGDFIEFAVQRFQVHLHNVDAPFCETCTPDPAQDGQDIVPLLASQPVPTVTTPGQATFGPSPYVASRTKEDKFQDHKKGMKDLKASLLAGSVSQPSTSVEQVPENISRREERYVDRAKLRRALYPTPSSDAQPARSTHQARLEPIKPVEPTYGAGSALYKRMLASSGAEGTASPDTASDSEPEKKKVKVGQVVEVRRTVNKGAGLGSAMLSGVENVGGQQVDWRGSGRDRRWQEVFGNNAK